MLSSLLKRELCTASRTSLLSFLQGLSLVLSEGGLRDREKEHPMEEDSGDSELLQGYQWLLRDLPKLPLFDSVRASTAVALQQVRLSGAGDRKAFFKKKTLPFAPVFASTLFVLLCVF